MTQHTPVASFFLEIQKHIGPRSWAAPTERRRESTRDPSCLVLSRNPNIPLLLINALH